VIINNSAKLNTMHLLHRNYDLESS